MGRIVLNRYGAARRPAHHTWVAYVAVGCLFAIGYVLIKRFIGGR